MCYLVISDLFDVGSDCCCFVEGGFGVDEQYFGVVLDQFNGDVIEWQLVVMYVVGQVFLVEVYNCKGNVLLNFLIICVIIEGCLWV